jgi:hypothetical protein
MLATPKYRNKKTIVKGIEFDSKSESYIYLKLLELSKTYGFRFTLQPRYCLVDKFYLDGKCFRQTDYIGDFDVFIGDEVYTLDSKGFETDVFRLKKKLFAKRYKREIICIKSVSKLADWLKTVRKKE